MWRRESAPDARAFPGYHVRPQPVETLLQGAGGHHGRPLWYPPTDFGADNAAIVKKLLDAPGKLVELVPERRRAPLLTQIEAISTDADDAIEHRTERPDVRRVAVQTQDESREFTRGRRQQRS